MASTLVIVLAETRASEITFQSFNENLLCAFDADLALCIAENDREDTSNPFYRSARYVWSLPEPEDWGKVFDEFQEQMGIHKDWRQLLQIKKQWLGGVEGEGAHLGSAGILLAFRWFLKRSLIDSGLVERYTRFIVTRSDFVHRAPHLPASELDPRFIWVANGENYGGLTDRHIVASQSDILDVLSVGEDLLVDPQLLFDRMEHRDDWNLERLIFAEFERMGLRERVRRFPYTMYSVRPKGGHTRWSEGDYKKRLGYYVKYNGEYRAASISRLVARDRTWSARKVWLANHAIAIDRDLMRLWNKVF